MKCNKYQELISAYIDGMLSLQEEEQLKVHMQECADCEATYHALKQIVGGCKQLEMLKVPEDFHEQLMSRIGEKEGPSIAVTSKKGRWRWQYSGALVATLLVGGLCLTQLNGLMNQKAYEQYGNSTHLISEVSIRGRNGLGDVNDSSEMIQSEETTKSEEPSLAMQDSSATTDVEVVVKNLPQFEVDLEAFLNQLQIAYKKIESGHYSINQAYREQLIGCIQTNSEVVEWKDNEGIDLEDHQIYIVIHEMPQIEDKK